MRKKVFCKFDFSWFKNQRFIPDIPPSLPSVGSISRNSIRFCAPFGFSSGRIHGFRRDDDNIDTIMNP